MHFVVYLSTPTDVAAHQIIPFDMVQSNIGNGYNVSTHKFRPPYNGTYEFTLQIVDNDHSNARGEISVNGQWMCKAHTELGK